jgi:hypothetical protein
MKRCPTCKRTYADDGFTFCLDDGALLSAPYDPQEEKPVRTIRSSGPPPTAVLPDDSNQSGRSQPREQANQSSPLPPTVASPAPSFGEYQSAQPRKRSRRRLTVFLIVIFIGLGAVLLYVLAPHPKCPQIEVKCSQYASTASCYLEGVGSAGNPEPDVGPAIASLRPVMALQAASAPLPKGINKITWSVSPGQIRYQEFAGMGINTTGLSGQVITVKATYTGDSSSCSGTATTTFVALSSTTPGP